MPDAVVAARWQFAFTIMFHYLFPVLTMGLGVLIAVLKTIELRTGNTAYGAAARFWARIFAITFATGVVTGIPMEFQFGTNWARFSRYAGPVVGQTLFMEGVFAFFAESSFLGVFLFGESRVSPRMHWLSAVMVAFGAVLSGFFIVATNAWMQHPVGYRVVGDHVELTSLWALLSNPYVRWQYPHVIAGSLVTASMVMAGTGAFYLLLRKHEEAGRIFVRVGVVSGAICSMVSLFPTGAFHGEQVTRFQPAKVAAMEGLFKTQEGAPLAIIGMPDRERQELMDPIVVPGLISYLAYGNFNAKVTGLNDIPPDQQPPVEIVYYAYHIMVGLGTIFIAITAASAFFLWRGTLFRRRGLLWILMLSAPFPYIANEAGWTVAEVGRQPWSVYELQRVAESSSLNVTTGMTYFTLFGFMGLYLVLGLLYLLLFARIVNEGPAPEQSWWNGVTLNTAWFLLLAFMLAGYAVLDGFDLGIGAIHLLVGRNRDDRARLIDTIGPVWNGNEVWLLGAGGALVAAFPNLYAASFSGFYLALMLVLWLLLLRGIGIEFRHQIHHPLWEDFWDVVFSIASVLLALLFGVALGNVLRGVPFEANGEFRGSFSVLLNGFSILAGVLSVVTLAMHGACWAALKTEGPLQARARQSASIGWWASLALLVAMIAASFLVRPDFTRNFTAHVWLLAVPLLTVGAFAGARASIGRNDLRAFLCSSGYVAGILASIAAGLYPALLPATPGSASPGLDIYNAAAPHSSLQTALVVYLVGLAIVSVYLVTIYRVWRGKTRPVYH